MEKPDRTTVLIIDPIFRGSRLMNSCHVAKGLEQRNVKVHILSRAEAVTDHYGIV